MRHFTLAYTTLHEVVREKGFAFNTALTGEAAMRFYDFVPIDDL